MSAMQHSEGAWEAQKAAGDEAFRGGLLEQALEHYSEALRASPGHVATLCNRSLAALKLGLPEDALRDAEEALDALSAAQTQQQQQQASAQLAKAVHRKAEVLAAMGRRLESLRAYRQGLAACPCNAGLLAALRLALEEMPVGWLAKYWAAHVEEAQQPNQLSSRDGRLIRPVPPEHRLSPEDLEAHLEAALYPLQDEARDLLCDAWGQGRKPGRAEAAFMRAAAYLNSGDAQQAFKDVRFALVYGPQQEQPAAVPPAAPAKPAPAKKQRGGKEQAEEQPPPELPPPPAAEAAGQHSAWPAALGLLSAALESLADNVPAALAAQRALELDPECEDYAEARDRLLRRIPEPCADALQAGGAAGLEAHLAAAREAALPEFKRQRPKYYYYFEWMKKRILGQYPELPEPVMDKLLALEANELDMILQYPRATQITVERLMQVYEREGAEKLEGYAVPLLTWDDYQACKEGGTASLALPPGEGASAAAAGRLLEGGSAGQGQGAAGEAADAGAAGGNGPSTTAAAKTTAQRPVSATTPTAKAAAPGAAQAGAWGDDSASEAGSVDVDELCALD